MNAFREIGVMADRINLPRKIQVRNLFIFVMTAATKFLWVMIINCDVPGDF